MCATIVKLTGEELAAAARQARLDSTAAGDVGCTCVTIAYTLKLAKTHTRTHTHYAPKTQYPRGLAWNHSSVSILSSSLVISRFVHSESSSSAPCSPNPSPNQMYLHGSFSIEYSPLQTLDSCQAYMHRSFSEHKVDNIRSPIFYHSAKRRNTGDSSGEIFDHERVERGR